MADLARNHHFIPEFFLASFTPSGTKDGFLWVTDMEQLMGYTVRPRNTGFCKDFYLVDVDGAQPDVVERIFGWFEGYAAPAVRYVLEKHRLPPRLELDHLMELIDLVVIRVPRTRERVKKVLDKVMKATFRPYFGDPAVVREWFDKMRDEGIDIPDDIDYEELVRFAQNEELYTMGVEKEWLLGQMLQASLPAQQMLFGRNWSVLTAESGTGEFICSDAPVCLTWTETDREDRIARLYEPETDLTVPIGKTVALRGRYEPGQPETVCCDRIAVAHVNIRTISSADRFLYSSSRDFPWERDDGSIGDWDRLIVDLKALGEKQDR